jgi:hypothetical protein
MRRIDHQQADVFSYLSPKLHARQERPLHAVTVEILDSVSPLFDAMRAQCGGPSIPPEKLLRVAD